MEGFVGTHDVGILFPVSVDPAGNNGQFHKTGNDRSQCCTFDTHSRGAEVAENQDVVTNQVDQCRGNARHHGNEGISGLFQGAGISLGQGKGQEAPDHHMKILLTLFQNLGCQRCFTLASKIQTNQGFIQHQEQTRTQHRDQDTDQELEPECMAHTLMIPGAVELGGENTGAGTGTENAQVKHKHQLIDDGNTAHRDGSHLANHDVIQHGDEVGDEVLNDDWNCNGEYAFVKRFITKILFTHRLPLKDTGK